MKRTLIDKLGILADAAKYDASCASSGTSQRKLIGQVRGWAPQKAWGFVMLMRRMVGVSPLLKVLLTNFCIFDCRYCINRSSSNVERARFTPQELITPHP